MVGWTHLSRFAAPNSAHCTNAVAMFLCSVSRGEEGRRRKRKSIPWWTRFVVPYLPCQYPLA